MAYQTIELITEGGCATLILRRPHALNALDAILIDEVTDALDKLAINEEVRALVITGSGRAFCAGADLSEKVGIDVHGTSDIGQIVSDNMRFALNPMLLKLTRMTIPTIAAVNGVAAGGGFGLALSCDIIVASRSASFVNVFLPKLGIVPDCGVTWHLPRILGQQRARALTYLGEPISANQALEWGLIWKCVDDEMLMKEAADLAARLASGPRLAYSAARDALAQAWDNTLAQQLDLEATIQSRLTGTKDFREGVSAFRERRMPVFRGQ